MDKQKLRELMRDQISTFDCDITKKLNYLINSKLLDYNYYKLDVYRQKLNFTSDNDLLNAFIGNSDAVKLGEDGALANAFMAVTSSSPNPSEPISSEQKSSADVNTRIQNINARLAALRGVSMPGDYLRKK